MSDSDESLKSKLRTRRKRLNIILDDDDDDFLPKKRPVRKAAQSVQDYKLLENDSQESEVESKRKSLMAKNTGKKKRYKESIRSTGYSRVNERRYVVSEEWKQYPKGVLSEKVLADLWAKVSSLLTPFCDCDEPKDDRVES